MSENAKISGFQFQNPILTKLNYNINQNQSEKLKNIQTDVKIDPSNKNDRNATVALSLKIGTENTPFFLEIEMQSIFKWDNSFSNDEVDDLLNKNAPSLLLSYMRPIVSETTGYGFNSVMLPFIDFSNRDE